MTMTPAAELRAAAERARQIGDPLHSALAALLELHAKEYDASVVAAADVWPDSAIEAARWLAAQASPEALAVARQLLGTTTGQPETEPPADRRAHVADALANADGWIWAPGFDRTKSPSYQGYLRQADAVLAVLPAPADRAATRDRIRRAICEASGFTWLPDELMEPDEYGEHADAVLAVLDAPADRAAVLNAVAAQYEQMLADIGADTAQDPRYWTGVQHVTLGLRRLAGEAAAGAHHHTTADKAAALGMTPTEYRQHSYNTAVQQIRAASRGLFAGTAIRVADALEEPTDAGAHHPEQAQPPGGFATRVCRNCSRTITWVPGGTWTHEPHNPDGGHIAAPYSLPAECHVTPAVPAAPEEQPAPALTEEAKPRLLWSDLLGADPDITGGACTQCYMDRARDRDHDMSPEHAHCRAALDGDAPAAPEETR